MPAVNSIALSSDIPGTIIRYQNGVRNENEDARSNFTSSLIEMDDKFIPTYGIEMLAGRNLKEGEYIDFERQTARVVINEVLMKDKALPAKHLIQTKRKILTRTAVYYLIPM